MLKTQQRWVNWEKGTKIPLTTKGTRASSTDPETWASYEEVKKSSDRVGVVFTPEKTLLGIDIDHCVENGKIKHEKEALIHSLIEKADTHTEFSPSGTGLHLYIHLTEPLKLESNKKAPFEVYTEGRYFTYTEDFYGEKKEVQTVTREKALELLDIIGYPWKESPVAIEKAKPTTDMSMDDEDVLKKMFGSKNGAKVKALWDGDLSENGGDDSSADMTLLLHLAFWTQKDSSQMSRMWLSSPLGQRKKTVTRKDYRDRTIGAAVSRCTEVYKPRVAMSEVTVQVIEELNLLFITGAKGSKVYLQNTENICRVLRNHPNFKGRLRHDEFKTVYEVFHTGRWNSYSGNDAVVFQTEISILFPEIFGKVTKGMVEDAIFMVAKENAMDSAKDFVSSLVWDKAPRLDNWLHYTYGAPQDEYHTKVGANWIKGLVKRIVYPGCKFDYVIVLEGPQGSKKSTSLGVLGGDWHVETTMSTDSKDFFMQFEGKAIVEFSEGETLSRTEVKKMKAIITTQVDKYRKPYERTSQDFPRRCVFAMTTNQEEYLKDETGNRRWLPVSLVLDEADIEWLKTNRKQILAEAYHRVVVMKETIYEFPKEETENQQSRRRVSDPNADILVEWYLGKVSDTEKADGITTNRAYAEALHRAMPSKPMTMGESMSIANVFKEVLRLKRDRPMINGVRQYRFLPTKQTPVKTMETEEELFSRNF